MASTNVYYTEGDDEHFFPIDENVKFEEISDKRQRCPSQLKIFHPREWTHEQVAAWLRGLGKGYEQYVETFRESGIDGDCLRHVDKDTIGTLVKNTLHGRVILHHLKNAIWKDNSQKSSMEIEEHVSVANDHQKSEDSQQLDEQATVSHQNTKSEGENESTSAPAIAQDEQKKRQSDNFKFPCFPKIPAPKKRECFGEFLRNSKYLLHWGADLSCGAQGEVAKLYGEDVSTMHLDGRMVRLKEHGDGHMSNGNLEPTRTFKCNACAKTFSLSRNLTAHMRIHTEKKRFPSSVYLKRHTRVQTRKKPVKCNTCTRTFCSSSYLKLHTKIHTGERPLKCRICEKRFIQSCHLVCHTRKLHPGVKPFKCDCCAEAFNKLRSLKTHTKIHTAEKPFKCSICGKRFIQPRNLATHMKIHTGEKPFKCRICEKRYILACNLMRHMEVHPGVKPFKCESCAETFNKVRVLKTHMKIHAGVKR